MADPARGRVSTLRGGAVVDSDPAAPPAGTDLGFALEDQTLRAPDVAVGGVGRPGWVKGVPTLAIEYADAGQAERSLCDKIAELFAAGTRWVWVVRLVGDKHVEVHEHGKTMRRLGAGQELSAPGVLANPVPVEALWDRDAAHEATLRNLVNRKGFESFDIARVGARRGVERSRARAHPRGARPRDADGVDHARGDGRDGSRRLSVGRERRLVDQNARPATTPATPPPTTGAT